MLGGVIKNNEANWDGGGIYVFWTSTFNMTGGEITDNSAGEVGGGVLLAANTTFTGNPQIGSKVSGRGAIYHNVPGDLFQDDGLEQHDEPEQHGK
jgi:hypothetical protein